MEDSFPEAETIRVLEATGRCTPGQAESWRLALSAHHQLSLAKDGGTGRHWLSALEARAAIREATSSANLTPDLARVADEFCRTTHVGSPTSFVPRIG
jgi:hypothetical protein